MPTKKLATAQDFKKKANREEVLDLPSGATIKARNPGGLRVFMRNGAIPNALLPMVEEAINGGQAPDMSMIATEGKINLDMIEEMMTLVDLVTVECWVLPPVLPVPQQGEDRDPELLYVDEVMEDDKLFVFQWVTGGTKDLEQFRKEQEAALVSVDGKSHVEAASK